MTKTISTSVIVAIVTIAMLLSFTGMAFAGQNLIGAGFSSAPAGTVGPGISGEIYGNTSNPSGNGNGVLPSLAPGPWMCGDSSDCAAEPTESGGSMGDFLAPVASDGTATPNFANGKTPGPDFSDN